MKKLLAILLTLTLLLSLCTTAFAVVIKTDNESTDITMTATFTQPEYAEVYSVDIQWEEMKFALERIGAKVWNPETYKYDIADGSVIQLANGDDGARDITVTNHSNAPVDVAVTLSNIAENWTVGVTNDEFDLAKVEEGATAGNAATATVTLTGWPEDITEQSTNFGTVTVTITGK